MSDNQKIITRFAPSPTGLLHLGNYRTAVFSYLFAKKSLGKFIVRVEDTDKERSKKEYEENILESLAWLGLPYDEVFRQSDRLDRHEFFLNKLIEEGKAYISKEEAKDGSGVIKEIVRFKNPNKKVSFNDFIRGPIEMDTTDLGDFVIAKNIHEPLFHLAVVVDDFEMGVTHIVRGEDHIANTPRQIVIQEAIGAPIPIYAHLPLVLSPDRSKLSKRKGALALTEYREQGYLPQAVLNSMALIGWNPGGEQEIFTLSELEEIFDLSKVQKGSAIFNQEKLDWINKEHIKKLNAKEQLDFVLKFISSQFVSTCGQEKCNRLLPTIIERINFGMQITDMEKNGELDFVIKTPSLDVTMLNWNGKQDSTVTSRHLSEIKRILSAITEDEMNTENSKDHIKETIMKYASAFDQRGAALHPLRYALTGLASSPDPFSVIYVLGKEESLSRIQIALETLSS